MYTTVQCLVEIVNGHLIAQSPNPAVPYSLLAEIWKWMSEKTSLEDVVVRLRPRTVPNGYKYHTWKEGTIANNRKPLVYYYRICITTGKSETITDMMRSILAQLEFKYQILEWERKGVPFRQHLYILEIHPVTKQAYFEMEDEPHVLKVCVCLHVCIYASMRICGALVQFGCINIDTSEC